jgi:hypothetical protein
MWWKTVVQPSGFTSTVKSIVQTVVQVTDLPSTLQIEVVKPYRLTSTSHTSERQREYIHARSSHKTNHTSALVDVVENSGSTIMVYSTAAKHNAQSGTGQRPFTQLCTSKWSTHIGYHTLPTHVSIHIHARM